MRSRGVLEFKTRPSDFGRIGGEIRLMAERNETHLLPLSVSETMVATNASYSDDLFRISCNVFGPPMCIRSNSKYSVFHEDIMISDIRKAKMSELYTYATRVKIDMDNYVAVARRKKDLDSIVDYAQRIFVASGYDSVPAWTFLLKDEEESVLYVRRYFLESFKTGIDILNVVRMQEKVREENEKKTYRENWYQ